MPLPSLFVSHGSPMLALEDCPARDFLRDLSSTLPRPDAILMVSAHWEALGPSVETAAKLPTIHDFYGFPDALYRQTYPASGDPVLAQEVAALLSRAGLQPRLDDKRGLDHGAWVPLTLAYPGADIPVVQVSLLPVGGPAAHLAIGRALAPLRERNVLVIGSGSLTHNLRELDFHHIDAAPPAWVRDFRQWVRDGVEGGDAAKLVQYRTQAPAGARNHPTEEHFLPLFVAMGAGAEGAPGRLLHASVTYGALAMDAYAFD